MNMGKPGLSYNIDNHNEANASVEKLKILSINIFVMVWHIGEAVIFELLHTNAKNYMAENNVQGSRLAYIDKLRALMIIFVVLVHAGVTYSGLGSWYMIAPCGMNCRDKNKRSGCGGSDDMKPKHCVVCGIKNCEALRANKTFQR